MTASESAPAAVLLPESGWATKLAQRILVPSFSDCFFLAILIWLFVAGASGWKALLMDGDTGWHIRTGEYILDHGRIPRQDLFSYSRPGAPWFAWEWLSDIAFAVMFRAAGLKGVVLFAGVMIAGISTVLLRYTLWLGANSLVAVVTTLLAVGSSTIHFLARPHLFTLLLLPIAIWVLQRDRRRPGHLVWVLIPLTAVWANLHGGFVVFLACLTLLVVGLAMESRFFGSGQSAVRRYTVLLAACSAATVLNPYGIQLHVHIGDYLRSDWIRNLVQEFQAPTFRGEGQFQFELLLIVGLLCTGVLIVRKRIAEALWVVSLAHASLTSVRHAPLYALVVAPLVAVQLSVWWKNEAVEAGRGSLRRLFFRVGEDLTPAFTRMSVWTGVAVLVLACMNSVVPWPRDFPQEAFPTDLIARNRQVIASGRVFTTDQWGDYLIYSFYPRQKVFIDGRSDFYGERLGKEYLALMEGSHTALNIVQEQAFDVILLPVEWPLAELLKHQAGWKLIEDNGHAILFVAEGRHHGSFAVAANETIRFRRHISRSCDQEMEKL
jgi:hypothetical protein